MVTVEYQVLENEIHHFKFLESTLQTLEDWFEQVEKIEQEKGDEAICRYLVDATEAYPPIRHIFQKASQRILRGDIPQSRIAILHRRSVLVTMVEVFIRRLPQMKRHQVRLFLAEERDKAIDWLLL
ncbi:MAG: hypothetical protein CUN55_15275 [Phototrophicales bacterium]|nr:MAG: hypothetical protein CUN55_15275 [Phototrophicales bacterium]